MPIELTTTEIDQHLNFVRSLVGRGYMETSILRNWARAKEPLFELFGGQLRIEREFSTRLSLDDSAYELNKFLKSKVIRSDREFSLLKVFIKMLPIEDVCNNYLSESVQFFGQTFKSGARISRLFSKLCPKGFGEVAQIEYSKFLQSLNGTGTAVLSIHPTDYVIISEYTTGWRSCHSLDGEYKVGNFAYMQDSCTVVAYVQTSEGLKSWRQLAFINLEDNTIVQSRQYPRALQVNEQFISSMFVELLQKKNQSVEFDVKHLSTENLGEFVYDEDVVGERLWYNDVTAVSFSSGTFIYPKDNFELEEEGWIRPKKRSGMVGVGSDVRCLCGCGRYLETSEYLFCYDNDEYDDDEEQE